MDVIHANDSGTVVVDESWFANAKEIEAARGLLRFRGTLLDDISFGVDVEAEVLKNELRNLGTERRAAILHYAPVRATVEGESPSTKAAQR